MSDRAKANAPTDPSGLIEQVEDTRPPALGLGRIVMVFFWAVGIWASATAIVDLFHHHDDSPWGPQIVALVAGIVYLAAAVGLTHNGRRMRILGWACIGLSIVVPIVLWIAGLGIPELTRARSAWTGLGIDFYYIPLIVSLIGLVWMWVSNPRRIVELAEQVERPKKR